MYVLVFVYVEQISMSELNAAGSNSNHGNADATPDIRDATGRYVRKAFIARGAAKLVFKALDEHEGVEVAWNEMDTGAVVDSRKVTHEVQLLARLRHPNVIRFCDAWVDQERRCLVFITELMTSGTLAEFIARHGGGVMKTHVIAKYGIQILQGICYLHSQNIIHRDVKCHNIFVNGHKGEVKIGDFGLSVNSRAATSVIGTPEFMAPEIYEEHYTNRVDIWSFGMCMIQMATGKSPYEECENVGQIFKRVTAGVLPSATESIKDARVKDIILQCLRLDPEQRPSAQALLNHPLFTDELDGGTTSTATSAITGALGVSDDAVMFSSSVRMRSVASQCEQGDQINFSATSSRWNSPGRDDTIAEASVIEWLVSGPHHLQLPSARLAASLGLLSNLALATLESRLSSRATSESSCGSPTATPQNQDTSPSPASNGQTVGSAVKPSEPERSPKESDGKGGLTLDFFASDAQPNSSQTPSQKVSDHHRDPADFYSHPAPLPDSALSTPPHQMLTGQTGEKAATTSNYSEEKKRRALETEQRLLDQLDLLSVGSSSNVNKQLPPNAPTEPSSSADAAVSQTAQDTVLSTSSSSHSAPATPAAAGALSNEAKEAN